MRKKIRVILLLTAAALTIMLFYGFAQRSQQAVVQVSTQQTVIQDVYNSVYAPGEVEAVDSNTYTVAQAATVEALYVQSGDTVAAGQALVRLRNTNAAQDALSYAAQAVLPSSSIVSDIPQAQPQESFTITAEIAGTVLEAPSKVGDTILPGIPYLTIADTSTLRIRADIPESYASEVREGQRANIISDAAPEVISAAQVASVAPYARRAVSFTGKANAATVTTVLDLLGRQDALRPGYTVEVKIFTDTAKDAVLVPYSAVIQQNNNEFVYIVDADGKARRRTVQTGYELSEYIQIRAGVAKGETVIVSPPETLRDGDAVEAVS